MPGDRLRILLIANFKPDEQESMQRFCELMSRGLANEGETVGTLAAEPFFVRLVRGTGSLHKWLGYLDKFVVFPLVLARHAKDWDVVHICDHSNGMYTRFLGGRPNVVTCHDLMAVRSALGEVAENPTGWSGRLLQASILRGLRRAQVVACASEQTRRDVLRVAARRREVTPCVLNGLNYPYTPMDRGDATGRIDGLLPDASRPFLLHVGGNQWYKNRSGVLEIFAGIRSRKESRMLRMVMVGKPFTTEMRTFIQSRGLGGDVVELTALPNEDLRALYSLAEGLLFPSLEEGFGWPILEAQACGCPVFTSNRPPMTEVGGNAAVYFDPSDCRAAVEAVVLGLERRQQLSVRGVENARRFQVGEMLQAYRKMYRGLATSESA